MEAMALVLWHCMVITSLKGYSPVLGIAYTELTEFTQSLTLIKNRGPA